jgi:hypothetical protein
VPAVGNLDCVGRALSAGLPIATAAITGDDADTGTSRQPCGHCAGIPIRQEIHDTAAFEITNERPISLTTLPGPIVYPDSPQWRFVTSRLPSNSPQQGISADRQHETSCKPRSRTTAKGETAIMYDPIEPNCPSGKRLGCLMGKSLGEDVAGTGTACTAKTPDGHLNDHGTAMRWQIRDSPKVMTMNSVRDHSTCWTLTGPRSSAGRDNHFAMLATYSVNQQSGWYQP